MWGAHIEKQRDDACMQVCIVYISVLDLVVDEMDGLLRYDMVWYGMVRYYLWAEKGCLYVCMRARVLGWAVLGWAVLCGAVLGCAVRCFCCAVLASLSESNEKKMKVKDKKRK